MRANQSAPGRRTRRERFFRAKPLRAALFGLVTLSLAWMIVTRSFVAYLTTAAPKAALLLRPGDATANLALADRKFSATAKGNKASGKSSDADAATAKALKPIVARALMAAPLDARALRLMGQFAEAEQLAADAERFMRAATRLSLTESIAVEWMMRRSFEKRAFDAAAKYADALLRSRPQFMRFAGPVLIRMADDPDGGRVVAQLLAENPPWRTNFFQALNATVSDTRTPLTLFRLLARTAAPATISERNNYLDFLIRQGQYELAYHAWLLFLPPESLESAKFLFNGSFESSLSGAPFDWTVSRGSGAIAEIAPRPGSKEQSALLVEFGQGRVALPRIAEIVMLPPGAYRFMGIYRGEVAGLRGVHWRLSCADRDSPIGEGQMILGSFPEWRNFEFDFVVPEKKCVAQAAQLVLSGQTAAEQLISGAIWFDEMSIVRRSEAEN